jgi:hypothetical protein
MDGTDVRELELGSTALKCAVLRQDEFIRDLEGYIDIDANGNTVFRRDSMVPSRELKPPEVFKSSTREVAVLHRNRLKCPAVFVRGLIPMMMELVTETVAEAQEQVNTELARRARYYW